MNNKITIKEIKEVIQELIKEMAPSSINQATVEVIKQLLPQLTDDNLVVIVNKDPDFPRLAFIQIDGWIGGNNVFSGNPDTINASGYKVPNKQELLTLPTGRYKLSDAKRMLQQTLKESVILDERMSYSELFDNTDDERINRSKTVRVRPLNVTTENNNEMWRFSYSSPERTEFKKYGRKVSHRGNIHFFKDSIKPGDNAEDLECMVDCDCRDFKFRWAWANAQDDASFISGKSLNKAINRPPNKTNPVGSGEDGGRRKQLCKHLAGLAKYLVTDIEKAKQRAHIRKRPMNIFEEMDRLTNQGQFQTTYIDNE